MKLARIEVRRLPGLHPPFTIEGLSPGLNLIAGPNGIGKSSLMRAVRATLWGTPAIDHPDVITVWDDGRTTWRAELVSRDARWQKDGAPAAAPAVPDESLASTWTVGLADLLTSGETEAALLNRVARQMAGGYDLRPVEERYAVKKGQGRAEARVLDQARTELHRVENERAALAGDEDGLEALRASHQEAKAALARAETLRAGLQHAEARGRLELARARLEAFPPALADLTEDAPERLAQLDADLAAIRRELDEIHAALLELHADAAECALPAGPAADADLQAWRARAREAADTDRELATARDATGRAAAALEAARGTLGGGLGAAADASPADPSAGGSADTDPFGGAALDAVQAWARDALTARAAAAEAEARLEVARGALSALGSLPDDARVEALRQAEALLAQVAAPAAPARRSGALRLAALALLVAGGLLGLLVSPWLAILAGLGAGLLVAGLFAAPVPDAAAGVRAAWPAGLEPPRSWRPEDVRARRDTLRAEVARAEKAARLQEEVARLQADLQRRHRAVADTEARRPPLAAGLEDAGELRLSDLAARLERLRAAAAEHASAAAAEASLRARLQEGVSFLREALAPWSAAARELADPGDLEALVDDLADRSRRLRSAERRRTELEGRAKGLSGRANEAEARVAALLAGAGLAGLEDPVARARLADLVSRRRAFLEARDEVAHLEQTCADLAARISDPELLAAEPAWLEAQLDTQEGAAAKADAHLQTITRIEARLDDARRSADHEDALAAEEEAREALIRARKERLHREAAGFLLDEVRREHTEASLPQVFLSARALFARFTHGRYDLRLTGLEDGAPDLRVTDTTTGEGLGVGALSDGTRMQLLLATRVAFAASEEQDGPLPLFLDESLTATDPERFRAVAEALIEVTRAGRQVFYLTCDPADVARWRAACEALGAPAPPLVDLAKLRGAAKALPDEALVLEHRPPPPAPTGLDDVAYGKVLGVPRFDPFQGADSLHLFHLLRDDLPLLHRILSAEVTQLGPLRRLLAAGAGSLVTRDDRARLEALGRVADAFAHGWCEGRGLPVDRAALEASGALSGKFLDAVVELAEEVGGDAAALLEALRGERRPPRFQSRSADTLEAWLRDHGHLDERETLPPEILGVQCLAAAGDDLAAGALDRDAVRRTVEALSAATGRRRAATAQPGLFDRSPRGPGAA